MPRTAMLPRAGGGHDDCLPVFFLSLRLPKERKEIRRGHASRQSTRESTYLGT
jgi:hypothetical protein